jgi:hypothetical protein
MVDAFQDGHNPMIRIDLPYLYNLSVALEPMARLDHNKSMTRMDLLMALLGSQNALEALLRGSVFAKTLRSSRPLAEALLKLLKDQNVTEPGDFEKDVPQYEVWEIQDSFIRFKTAFLAELGTFPAYFVNQKGDRDTLTLLDEPWRMFPADLFEKAPEAMFDVAEAGKALCYERSTACGFHVFRATESVLRRYYTHVSGGKAPPKIRNIMVYVQAMRQAKCGDEKILSVIEHMSKLHRNPLIHPEVALTLDEAISVLGIAHSAVSAMLAVLPDIPPTTAATPVTEKSAAA